MTPQASDGTEVGGIGLRVRNPCLRGVIIMRLAGSLQFTESRGLGIKRAARMPFSHALA
jgi:hypothetical protein